MKLTKQILVLTISGNKFVWIERNNPIIKELLSTPNTRCFYGLLLLLLLDVLSGLSKVSSMVLIVPNKNYLIPTTTTTSTITTSSSASASSSSTTINCIATRRHVLDSIPKSIVSTSAVIAATGSCQVNYAIAATSTETSTSTSTQMQPNGIAYRLQQRDASVLKNKLFNIPPSIQVYPYWMRGEWDVQSNFSGYVFPSKTISNERIIQNFNVAGFQKCSIAATADVGATNIHYRCKYNIDTGYEDRVFNIQNQINSYLGYSAVKDVIYDGYTNPNRISINFVNYKTINAERIELFYNARESEEYYRDDDDTTTTVFVCSEFIRQVTFGTGNTVGVPRQAITNYANYYTWFWDNKGTVDGYSTNNNKDDDDDILPRTIRGNLLTVAYLDPQDPMYFEEPQKPVAVYSHKLFATRII